MRGGGKIQKCFPVCFLPSTPNPAKDTACRFHGGSRVIPRAKFLRAQFLSWEEWHHALFITSVPANAEPKVPNKFIDYLADLYPGFELCRECGQDIMVYLGRPPPAFSLQHSIFFISWNLALSAHLQWLVWWLPKTLILPMKCVCARVCVWGGGVTNPPLGIWCFWASISWIFLLDDSLSQFFFLSRSFPSPLPTSFRLAPHLALDFVLNLLSPCLVAFLVDLAHSFSSHSCLCINGMPITNLVLFFLCARSVFPAAHRTSALKGPPFDHKSRITNSESYFAYPWSPFSPQLFHFRQLKPHSFQEKYKLSGHYRYLSFFHLSYNVCQHFPQENIP